VTSDEKDEKDEKQGGIQLGSISFGFGPQPKERQRRETVKDPAGVRAQLAARGIGEMGPPLLPLRVLLVADLVPRPDYNAGASAPDHALRIDSADLATAFKKLKPRLSLELESVLLEGGLTRIEIAPTGLKSFRPDSLCREIPLLRSLLDGKKVLERLRDGTMSVDSAAAELHRLWGTSSFIGKVLGGVETAQPAGAAPVAQQPPAATEADVARILDMVDTGTKADDDVVAAAGPAPAPVVVSPEGKSKFDAVFAAVAKSGRSARPGARPDEGIRRIERAVGLQLGVLLQHPELRRLEEAWRGVDFLISRAPKEGVKLDLVVTSPDGAVAAIEREIAAGEGLEPPVSFVIVDGVVDGDAASLAWLRSLSELAEAHTMPIITNASAKLLGKSHLEDIDRLDNKASLYEAPEQAPWRKEAERIAMRWVALAMNRILARLPYDRRSSHVREATIEEQPAGDSAIVWLQPCWGVGVLILNSFAKTGWPCNITGARDGGDLENLPVREITLRSGETIAVPTEVFISTETQRELSRYGVLMWAVAPNNDSAYLFRAATAYVQPPKRTYDSATSEPEVRLPPAPLVDQLFVARLVQFLRALCGKIASGSESGQVKQVVEAALWELFNIARPGSIQLKADPNPGVTAVHVWVKPARFLGVSMEEIGLDIPLA